MSVAHPPIRGIADIEALERVPLEEQNDVWTVYDLVVRGAALDPGKAAFHYLSNGSLDDTPETISYRQLMERIHQAANLFHSLGVGAKDTVAILLPIVPQNYYALFGGITAGIVFPINWMLKPEQVAELLNATRAKILVALGPTPGFDIWERVCELRERVPSLVQVLQVKGPGGTSDAGCDFDALCARYSGERPKFERVIDPRDVAFYVHTGGTTGMPKIAQLIHRAVTYKAWAYAILLDQQASQCSFAAHPLFHIGGLVHHTMSSLARGQTSVILGPMGFRTRNVIRDYWKLVERYRVTDLGGVPTTLGALANVPPDADISTLRPYTMTGSAGLPIQVSRYFEKTIGVRILSNYGMTENTATIALPPRDGDPKFGSSGVRLPFTRIRTVVIDEAGTIERDCRTDEIGEIIISGPGVIPGYLDASLNAKLFVGDGWLRTGDLGRLDADRYIWVTGRAKDLIIRSGHNIDPRIIEDTLMAHEAVALAAAVGKPDSYAGELPVAFVQLKPGASVGEEELKEFVRSRIAERAAAPSQLFIVQAMPLTAVGKIFKPALRNRAACEVYAGIVRSIAGTGADPQVDIAPDPVHGTLVTVTLSRTAEGRDGDAERKIRAALDAFTAAYRIVWRDALYGQLRSNHRPGKSR
jgi:fatty-acyl-CoA synthase